MLDFMLFSTENPILIFPKCYVIQMIADLFISIDINQCWLQTPNTSKVMYMRASFDDHHIDMT